MLSVGLFSGRCSKDGEFSCRVYCVTWKWMKVKGSRLQDFDAVTQTSLPLSSDFRRRCVWTFQWSTTSLDELLTFWWPFGLCMEWSEWPAWCVGFAPGFWLLDLTPMYDALVFDCFSNSSARVVSLQPIYWQTYCDRRKRGCSAFSQSPACGWNVCCQFRHTAGTHVVDRHFRSTFRRIPAAC